MSWPELWYGDSGGASWARLALAPASLLYALGWTAYRSLYDVGIKRPASPFAPVLCIGNLTVGGSGKTPLTVFVAGCLRELGYRVVVGCSGYGAPRSEGATLAPDGPLDPRIWGDEPSLIRWLLPEVEMVVGRARVRAAERVREIADDRTVLLMDDGFQHLPLKKTASILVDPLSRNHWCLPAGPYREPRWNLSRADMVLGPNDAPFRLESMIVRFDDLNTGAQVDPPQEADAMCAIGRPEGFFQALAGFTTIRNRVAQGDHDRMEGALDRVSDPVIVTAKDAVKLRVLPEARSRRILVARHEVRVEPRAEFLAMLGELIQR